MFWASKKVMLAPPKADPLVEDHVVPIGDWYALWQRSDRPDARRRRSGGACQAQGRHRGRRGLRTHRGGVDRHEDQKRIPRAFHARGCLRRCRRSPSRTSRSTATTSQTPTRAPVVTAHTPRSARSRGPTAPLGDEHSALLVTSATEMWQFCYACHDATSQGADTNVQQGIYEGTSLRHAGRRAQRRRFRVRSTERRRPRPTCTRARAGVPTVVATSAPARPSCPTPATRDRAPTPS